MKTLYYAFCLTATCAFAWLAVYSYQHRASELTLAELVDRSNQESVSHKMRELYGE